MRTMFPNDLRATAHGLIRRVAAVVLVFGGATGVASAQDMPKAFQQPQPVQRPALSKAALIFTIDVRWLGATPYRIERDVTGPIERAVRTVPGVKEVHSSSTGSRAQTLVTFDAKEDASTLATALRNKLDQIKTRLPHGASQPLIGWRREPPI